MSQKQTIGENARRAAKLREETKALHDLRRSKGEIEVSCTI